MVKGSDMLVREFSVEEIKGVEQFLGSIGMGYTREGLKKILGCAGGSCSGVVDIALDFLDEGINFVI